MLRIINEFLRFSEGFRLGHLALAAFHGFRFPDTARTAHGQAALFPLIDRFAALCRSGCARTAEKQPLQRFLIIGGQLHRQTGHGRMLRQKVGIHGDAVSRKHLKDGTLLCRRHGVFPILFIIQPCQKYIQQYQQNNHKLFCIAPFHALPPFFCIVFSAYFLYRLFSCRYAR